MRSVLDMVSRVLAAFILGVLNTGFVAALPQGFILRVDPLCGNGSTTGNIIATSDMHIQATAKCENGVYAFPDHIDDAHYGISIAFNEDDNATCLMTKRPGASVYSTIVIVAWGEVGSPIISSQEQFVVTCSFGEGGKETTGNKTVIAGLVAPVEMQFHYGPATTSQIQLKVTDIKGVYIGDDIPAGKKIQLMATTDGNDGEVGLRPSSCDVVGVDTNSRYAILRAGCGDGIVFKKDFGFITIGNTTYSPFFSSFSLSTDTDIKFDCNFTTCSSNCDGNSCKERQERSPNEYEINAVSHTYKITEELMRRKKPDRKTSRLLPRPTTRSSHHHIHSMQWTVFLSVLLVLASFCVLSLGMSLYSFILINKGLPASAV